MTVQPEVSWLSYLLAIGAGAANPAQAGANSQLDKSLHNSLWTGVFVYLSGLICLLLVLIFVRKAFPDSVTLSQVPAWAWMGGVLSIASTMTGLLFARKMGSGTFTGLTVTASLLMSIVLDHFGLIGFKAHPASFFRITGGGLMVIGLWLVSKF